VFPFEREWYARNAPRLRVQWVGHPLRDRPLPAGRLDEHAPRPLLALLPGSRRAELESHWTPVVEAARIIQERTRLRPVMVLPRDDLLDRNREAELRGQGVEFRVGNLSEVLCQSALALASTGTVTLECALHEVPTVAFYVTSWSTYQIGRRMIRVPYLAMPNLLAGKKIMPECIQHEVTGRRLAEEAFHILENPERLKELRAELRQAAQSLGPPGACARAATALIELIEA